MPVGEPAEQPASKRPHEKPDREDSSGSKQLARCIASGEESRGKINRGEGVGVEIIPLDEVA